MIHSGIKVYGCIRNHTLILYIVGEKQNVTKEVCLNSQYS